MSSDITSSIMNRIEFDLTQSIDWEVLKRLDQLSQESGSQLLGKMIGLFQKNVPTHIENIFQSIDSADSEKLRQHLHSLKSATCYIGAIGVARICDQIRACIETSDTAGMKRLHEELKKEYERVLQILGCS